MFTWICPKCGSEVPPSENECPTCRARAAASAAPSQPAAEAVAAQPVPRTHAPAAAPAPVHRSGLSPALVALCSAVAIVVLLAVLYTFVLPRGSATTPARTELQQPAASSSSVPAHPLAKYIEVTGLRVREGGAGQVKIAYLLVNHSPADLPELKANLVLQGGGTTVFEFPLTIPSIGPYESRDLTTTLRTKMKPYELPDWQTLRPVLQILSNPE